MPSVTRMFLKLTTLTRLTIKICLALILMLAIAVLFQWNQTAYQNEAFVSKNTDVSRGKMFDSSSYINTMDEPDEMEMLFEPEEEVDLVKEVKAKETGIISKLIILTYMRSGSSITGRLLASVPGVFYVYEPLFSIQKVYSHSGTLNFLDRDPVSLDPVDFFSPEGESTRLVKNVLDCNAHSLDTRTLVQTHMASSFATHFYSHCVHGHGNETKGIEECLPQFTSRCNESKLVLTKVIRFSMKQVYALMVKDPSVGVLHLIRDPRGMFHSQVGKRMSWRSIQNESNMFCNRISDDLRFHAKIRNEFSKRTFLVRYEDMIMSPITAVSQIMTIVGLSVNIRTHRKLTYFTEDKDRPFAWRYDIKYQYVKTIQENCQHIMDTLGYNEFISEGDLLNKSALTFQTRIPSTDYNIVDISR